MSEKLAKDHWSYIEKLLISHEEDQKIIQLIEFHYKSAFIHGFKHGIEETLEKEK